MKDLYVRIPLKLRRRINVAAARAEVRFPRYCKKILDQWLSEGQKTLPEPVPGEGVEADRVKIKIAVSDAAWKGYNLLRIDSGMPVNTLVIRVLYHRTPMIEEVLLEELAG